MTSHTERPQSIASPSTAKHTETQYNLKAEIQLKGYMTVAASQGAGCAAASIRRAGAIHRMQEND